MRPGRTDRSSRPVGAGTGGLALPFRHFLSVSMLGPPARRLGRLWRDLQPFRGVGRLGRCQPVACMPHRLTGGAHGCRSPYRLDSPGVRPACRSRRCQRRPGESQHRDGESVKRAIDGAHDHDQVAVQQLRALSGHPGAGGARPRPARSRVAHPGTPSPRWLGELLDPHPAHGGHVHRLLPEVVEARGAQQRGDPLRAHPSRAAHTKSA